LKAAASEHLAAEANAGRPSVGDPRLQLKAAIIVIWFGLSYAALLWAPSLSAALVATLSLAFAASAFGFCVFHDANHGTLFQRPSLNLSSRLRRACFRSSNTRTVPSSSRCRASALLARNWVEALLGAGRYAVHTPQSDVYSSHASATGI
jgi:hypothetical protein